MVKMGIVKSRMFVTRSMHCYICQFQRGTDRRITKTRWQGPRSGLSIFANRSSQNRSLCVMVMSYHRLFCPGWTTNVCFKKPGQISGEFDVPTILSGPHHNKSVADASRVSKCPTYFIRTLWTMSRAFYLGRLFWTQKKGSRVKWIEHTERFRQTISVERPGWNASEFAEVQQVLEGVQ